MPEQLHALLIRFLGCISITAAIATQSVSVSSLPSPSERFATQHRARDQVPSAEVAALKAEISHLSVTTASMQASLLTVLEKVVSLDQLEVDSKRSNDADHGTEDAPHVDQNDQGFAKTCNVF